VAATNYDEIDRFLVFVEQLQVACELLEDGALGKVRAALVGVDNLANLVLHAHAKAVFRSGEDPEQL
jgi:small nuclear ribonucleoprotein (snRNP)-like protein